MLRRFSEIAKENFFVPKVLNFTLFFAWGTYFPFLGVFYRYVGYSQSQIGLLLSITPFIGSLAATFWTGLADKYHKHKLILLANMSVASALLMSMSFAVYFPFGVAVVVMMLFSFVRAPINPLVDTGVLSLLGEHRQLYGRQRVFASISWGSSSILTSVVVGYTSPHAIFYGFFLSATVFVLVAAAVRLFPNEAADGKSGGGKTGRLPQMISNSWKRMPLAATWRNLRMAPEAMEDDSDNNSNSNNGAATDASPEEGQTASTTPPPVPMRAFLKSVVALVSNRAYVLLLFATFVFASGMSIIASFLFVYLQDEYGAESSLLGVSVGVSILLELPLMFFGKTLLQKVGARRLIICAIGVLAIRLVAYTFISNPWQAVAIEFLHGLTYALLWIAGVDYANTVAPAHLKATSQGMYSAAYSLGSGLGAIIGGLVYEHFGAEILFRGEAVVCVSTLVVFSILSWVCADDAANKLSDNKKYARMDEPESLADGEDAVGGSSAELADICVNGGDGAVKNGGSGSAGAGEVELPDHPMAAAFPSSDRTPPQTPQRTA